MQTYKINKLLADKIINKYDSYQEKINNEYVIFSCSYSGNKIIIYIDKTKTPSKCTVAGPNESSIFDEFGLKPTEKKAKINKESEEFICTSSQIGSDEVGFGDFFGPIIVTAAYCDAETLDLIYRYGLKDSKKITDEKILTIVPQIIDKVVYSQLIVNNEKLTELFSKNYNLNKIKSILHNQVLVNVNKKIQKQGVKFFIDKFTNEDKYFEYISKEKEIVKDIEFRFKGESAYPSVALASCIARYSFIKKMEEMGDKYGVKIPFGASASVDEFAQKFKKKFGITELNKNVKTNFINYTKLN